MTKRPDRKILHLAAAVVALCSTIAGARVDDPRQDPDWRALWTELICAEGNNHLTAGGDISTWTKVIEVAHIKAG